MEIAVECQKRAEGSKPNALRRSGLIPAVLYGHKGSESISITVKAKTVETLLKKHAVNNTLIDLSIPELSWSGKTLLREVQVHPWKGFPYHLSFFSVATQDSLEVEVSLHFVGESVGVKLEGGMLETVLTQIAVKCKPDSIPDAIEVDISNLKVGDALHIHELVLPAGAEALGDPTQVVVTVLGTKASPEEEAEEAAAAA
ncbi:MULTISPECIES: 50S ribosomal protein L25/general stress protein Ctc [unclassified Microcoleus]|jgi:large subunit ribosomal protein L25|uniref:50S ribosomal protein L25/general stress protein Ctc n=1 Tax=unclassified Microcoleus TaxID=2642155 RepID=UPI001D88AB72|nr:MULTISPECIES: 50S ribosomal protein L25/general stress protein Ctc [unclassified Microcoleus]MCC3432781.1 50S ribosomal protein L25/general stress protein Ctc [Microcoleus sp. PH2017_04_SCI_O_A]MCC3507314.1 50S ribosomal protein L25/general stress protein Ctc [Microcoleus sp. PH2017_19_SFW_U_A]TAG84946.1 MAG: 50S ribosomal protein L25/general stress protein Ctc [Oscillatoriales cyanobacterium]MCC3526061.1 50S ribosomal protein L25/general stress protein Ctc [Microcoleus sp. PH2017_20_SFW_D_A